MATTTVLDIALHQDILVPASCIPAPVGRIALAVRKGDLQAVQRLLAEGCDPDEADYNGRVPLLDAVNRQDVDMVRLLLKSGCSVAATNAQGETSLHMAVQASPLCPDIVDALLQAGADPNVAERLTGNNALHVLVKREGDRGLVGRRSVLEILSRLVVHVDVNARTHHGRSTALHKTVSGTEDDDVAANRLAVLLRAGASADIQDEFGETALHLAVRRRFRRTVEQLIDVGADVNLLDRYAQTPLHFAASGGFDDVAQVLLKIPSCDVNVVDLNGETPLHLASGKGHAAVVRLLLARPTIRVDIADQRGMLAIHKAIESGFIAVVQELLFADCKELLLTKTSGYDMTPVDLAFSSAGACRQGPEIAQLLLTALETMVDGCSPDGTPI